MVTEHEGRKPIDGLCVYDCIIITQMIDKLLRGGLVTGREVGHVAALRSKVIDAAARCDVDLNNLNSNNEQKET